MKPQIHVLNDLQDISVAAAGHWIQLARNAVEARGVFHVALSGGTTPRELYQTLASPGFSTQVPWESVQIYFGDERCVPPSEPASNFRMITEALLAHVPIRPERIHRIACEGDARQGAANYARELEALPRSDHGIPMFDLALLGVGADGHVASLFAGTPALLERTAWTATVYLEKLHTHRVTLTFPVLEQARTVFVLVAGSDKRDILPQVLDPAAPNRFPVQMLQAKGEVHWYLDLAAAAGLQG